MPAPKKNNANEYNIFFIDYEFIRQAYIVFVI